MAAKYYWIGHKYNVDRADRPKCTCDRPGRCSHYLHGKSARRLLRRIAKMQNKRIGKKLLGIYDAIARETPRGSHPHKKRQAIRSAL